jgi:hypothetical protein
MRNKLMVRYPDWCCQHCGEPLRTVPCLNCIQLKQMNEEDDHPEDGAGEPNSATVPVRK